jgi:acyltransferase
MNKLLLSRISWVDVCRGIGILLVLYGHAIDREANRYLIYAFHMPLFFFLSGIVFKPVSHKNFLKVIVKNMKQILIPYFLFAVLTFMLDFYLMHPYGDSTENIKKQIYGIFYGNGNEGYLAFNVALWFLPCLFVAKVAFAGLTSFVKNKKHILGILILLSLLGYAWSILLHTTRLPFGIESAMTATVFLGIGYLWNQSTKVKNFMTDRKMLVLCTSIAMTILFAYLNYHFYGHQIDMRLNRLNNYFFFYGGAFNGIIVCLITSMLINKNYILEYLGKHSLLLFAWHTVLYAYFRTHSIPPIKIAYVSPVLYLIMATSIILAMRFVVEKIKFATLYRRNKVTA